MFLQIFMQSKKNINQLEPSINSAVNNILLSFFLFFTF